jgi:hypothetical protein
LKSYTFSDVLREEYRAIHAHPDIIRQSEVGDTAAPSDEKISKYDIHELRKLMMAKETSALCLSGGGIRSAAFCLGTVQALARGGFLRNFHYISTVSGGGYLGSMLAAWGYRASADYSEVEDGLMGKPRPVPDPSGKKKPVVVDPVNHLREFTSYLSPRYGLFSIDTWTLLSTYLRNLLLNWLILVPLFCAVFLIPHLFVAVVSDFARIPASVTAIKAAEVMLIVGVVLSMCAIALWRGTSSLLGKNATRVRGITFVITILSLLAGALICFSGFIIQVRAFEFEWTLPLKSLAYYPAVGIAEFLAMLDLDVFREGEKYFREDAASSKALRLPFAYVLLGIGAWIVFWMSYRPSPGVREINWLNLLVSFVAAGFVTGLALYCWSELFLGSTGRTLYARVYWTFGPPLVVFAFAIAEILLIGLVSKQTTDFDREWWARMGARLLIAALVWVALFAIALLVPAIVRNLVLPKFEALFPTFGALVIFLGSIIARIAFKRGEPATEKPEARSMAWLFEERILNVAGLVFIILFMCTVAFGLDSALKAMTAQSTDREGLLGLTAQYSYPYGWINVSLLLFGIGIFLWIVQIFIHINRFSLHAMYRERLIRTFLGGTRADRQQPSDLDSKWAEERQYERRDSDPSTGFDRYDNPILWWLAPARRSPIPVKLNQRNANLKSPPFLIVNCALNLAGSERLAWQERKASSFTFTPLHSGSDITGYRRTRDYSGEVGGITLGTALTISGAAVSPNAGQNSSPILTAVLTLFNARLGAWMGNPNNAEASLKQGPTYALWPMIRELLGRTNEKSTWIHLSDGGHFDNLGIYEAVKRGCRHVVAIDASADHDRRYDDLGIALRKIRLDLGIDVELVGNWWIGRPDLGAGGRYCALYYIKYPNFPVGLRGTILYVKPGIYPYPASQLPMDILQFSRTAQTFPHESTVNQFFTESQFESYRALGEHEMQTIIGSCREDMHELMKVASAFVHPPSKTESGVGGGSKSVPAAEPKSDPGV